MLASHLFTSTTDSFPVKGALGAPCAWAFFASTKASHRYMNFKPCTCRGSVGLTAAWREDT